MIPCEIIVSSHLTGVHFDLPGIRLEDWGKLPRLLMLLTYYDTIVILQK